MPLPPRAAFAFASQSATSGRGAAVSPEVAAFSSVDMRRAKGHQAHPSSEAEADRQRSTKPHLNAPGISHYIGLEITARNKAETAFARYCGAEDARQRVHYYEDLVDSAPGAVDEWARVLRQLGVARGASTPSANYTIIRGSKPPLDSVANPDAARAALANSRHAWMLEEKYVLTHLQSTHAVHPTPSDPRRLTQPGEALTRVACLGDSLTRGDGSHESPSGNAARGRRGRGNYPALLGAALGAGYRVRNFGHDGATAASYGHLPDYVRAKEYAPDIELWMLGTNDSKDFNRSRYVGDFRRTIEALGSSHIIIMSPPPVLAERYGINPAIVDGAVPSATREVATAVGAHFFDLHRLFSEAAGCLPRTPSCATHFMPDGIHTNEKGTALIAKLARHALDEVLPPPALTN